MLEQTDDMFLRYRFWTGGQHLRLPSEVFYRNFWATFMVDTHGVANRHKCNIDHIMWSTDNRHTGTDWPNSRATLERNFRGVPCAEVKKMIHDNAGAYGSTGPFSYRPAFHPIAGAISGGAVWQAGRDMPPPPDRELSPAELREASRQMGRANEGNPDPNSALVVATGALLALYARERFGEGQYVETTMICANAYACSDDFLSYEGKPPRPLPDGGLHGLNALYRLYPARASWVFLGCVREAEWHALCRGLDRPDLATDPRFADRTVRRANDAALAAILAGIFADRPADEWERLLVPLGVGCVRADACHYSEFLMTDPHVEEAGIVAEVDHFEFGRTRRHGLVADLSLTPTRARPGCALGEHTREILAELGYTPEEIQGLRDRRVVIWPSAKD